MVINFLGFYVVWWCCALLSKGSYWPVNFILSIIFIFLHFRFISNNRSRDLKQLLAVFFVGIMLDLTLSYFGIFKLSNNFLVWLIPIWLIFPLTLNYSLKRFFLLPKIVIFILAAISGVASYKLAASFNLLFYPQEFDKNLIHAICWGIFMLIFSKLKDNHNEN